MRALRFDRFGDPDVLYLADLPDPVTQPGAAVIAVKAASVNGADAYLAVEKRIRGKVVLCP